MCNRACLCTCVCVCVAPTSEALTRPSWKEQLDGSWVHRLRYLHQWQRKALLTHDRHLRGHKHTQTQRVRVKKRRHSQGECVYVRVSVCVCVSLPKRGKCHRGNEFRSQVGTCCCCALAVGTVPNGWLLGPVLSLHIFPSAVH